ncbi:MAG TPA: ACP S-malonyltransferase [Clostridia bacterium]|nr:ACP S-malonyltransferase [Clostridia bacterium]
MKRVAFMFSGQGSQYTGMGKNLHDRFVECRRIFDFASEVLGINMRKLCFDSDSHTLDQTVNTQPAVHIISICALSLLHKYRIFPSAVAGYSLGEYAALYASGVFGLTETLYLISRRAHAMQQAYDDAYGMGVISGHDMQKVEALCARRENVWVANYNTPAQVSISGRKDAIQGVFDELDRMGGYRTMFLPVGGAFHTKMMLPAVELFSKDIKPVIPKKNTVPVVMNTTGTYLDERCDIKKMMLEHMVTPVRWSDSIETLLSSGIEVFIELGPGDTLSKYVVAIAGDRKIDIFHISDTQSLSQTVNYLYG